MNKKASFVLYHDLRGPLELLTDQDRGKLFLALFDYSESGILPQFDGALSMAFAFLKSSIDRDSAKWEEKSRCRTAAGRSGGLATQAKAKGLEQGQANRAVASFADQSEQFAANQAIPVSVPVSVTVPTSVPDNLSGINIVDRGDSEAGKPPTRKRFTPPTVDEVRQYCQELGSCIDPVRFVDFYESKGWMIGRNPMKSWKAAVRTWEQGEKRQPSGFKYDDSFKEGDSL